MGLCGEFVLNVVFVDGVAESGWWWEALFAEFGSEGTCLLYVCCVVSPLNAQTDFYGSLLMQQA